jgi:hypothetical protein
MSADNALRRSIGIVFADGGLLALTAIRPGGSADHGSEEIAAILCGPDGVQRRATLELWTDDDGQPLRGAGTLISASGVHRPGLNSTVAFFRWSLEGREGLGHYEVVRGDD